MLAALKLGECEKPSGVWRPVEFQRYEHLSVDIPTKSSKISSNGAKKKKKNQVICVTLTFPARELGLPQCTLKGETHILRGFFFSPVPRVAMPCPAVRLVVPRWLGTTADVALVRVRTCWQAPCSSQRGPQTWLTKTR